MKNKNSINQQPSIDDLSIKKKQVKYNQVQASDQDKSTVADQDKSTIADQDQITVADQDEITVAERSRSTYFISDLHLDPSRPHLFVLFHKFIEKIKPDVEALYILGDLFEFWIGDDVIDLPMGKPYLPVIEQLRSLSDSGVKLFFIQGNRDFLIGKKFMESIGGELLPDQHIIDLYGTKAIIMHGDTLCTDDKGYQLMRKIFRLWIAQKIYLSMSPEKRSQKAGQIRKTTSENTKQKSSMILDVNQQAVEDSVKTGGVSFLIHGHTHRPAEHDVFIDNQAKKRIVLGDWGEKWSYLEWSAEGEYQLSF